MNKTYIKLFVLLTIFTGIIINLFFVKTVKLSTTYAAESTVVFSFTPNTANLPPDADFTLNLDPKGQPIYYVQVTIFFNTDILQLNPNITYGGSITPILGTEITKDKVDEANVSGTLEFILRASDVESPPSQSFQVFTLPFTYSGDGELISSDVTIVDEDTQVVSGGNEDLPFQTVYAIVNAGEHGGPSTKSFLASKFTQGDCPENHIDTAIGCFPYQDFGAIAKFFLTWGLRIAGGVAFVLIVYAGYLIMTSEGDPKRLESGRQLLNAAIWGLLTIIFSAFLLRFVGIDILQIPGL